MAINERKKLRFAVVIGKEELKDRYLAQQLGSELLMIHGYIGYADVYDGTARMYVFENIEGAEQLKRGAGQIGFTSMGIVDGPVFIKNNQLERQHLRQYRSQYSFMKEYYR